MKRRTLVQPPSAKALLIFAECDKLRCLSGQRSATIQNEAEIKISVLKYSSKDLGPICIMYRLCADPPLSERGVILNALWRKFDEAASRRNGHIPISLQLIFDPLEGDPGTWVRHCL